MTFEEWNKQGIEEEQEKKKEITRKRRNELRRARDEAYKSCGMVKVKGTQGGTYWE